MLLLLGLLTLGAKTGTAHSLRCLQKWGDSRGIRRGFAGDSRGIRRLFGGFALKMHAFPVSPLSGGQKNHPLSLSFVFFSFLYFSFSKFLPVAPWNETPEELEKRLQQAVARINKDFNVRGLCMEFPDRLHDLANKTYGDRLPK